MSRLRMDRFRSFLHAPIYHPRITTTLLDMPDEILEIIFKDTMDVACLVNTDLYHRLGSCRPRHVLTYFLRRVKDRMIPPWSPPEHATSSSVRLYVPNEVMAKWLKMHRMGTRHSYYVGDFAMKLGRGVNVKFGGKVTHLEGYPSILKSLYKPRSQWTDYEKALYAFYWSNVTRKEGDYPNYFIFTMLRRTGAPHTGIDPDLVELLRKEGILIHKYPGGWL